MYFVGARYELNIVYTYESLLALLPYFPPSEDPSGGAEVYFGTWWLYMNSSFSRYPHFVYFVYFPCKALSCLDMNSI